MTATQTSSRQPSTQNVGRRSAALSLGDQCVASATNFMTSILIARACGKEELGLYALGFTAALIIMELQSALITTPYLVYSPRLGEAERARYSGSALVHQMGLCGVGILLAGGGVLLALADPAWLPDGILPVFVVLVAALPCIMIRDFVRRFCFARNQMGVALALDIAVLVLQAAGLGYLAWQEELSAPRAYIVIMVATLLPVLVWYLKSRTSFERGDWRGDLRRNLRLGGWVFASGLLWAISANLYPWLIASVEGTGAAGVFAACMQLLALANIPLMGTQNFLGPKLTALYATDGAAALKRFALKSSVLFGGAILLLAIFLWAIADLVLGLVYGDEFLGNRTTVLLLVLQLATLAAAFPISRALFAYERAGADFAVNIVPIVLLFAVGLPLIHAHGVVGGALGLFISGAAALVVRAIVFVFIRPREGGHDAS